MKTRFYYKLGIFIFILSLSNIFAQGNLRGVVTDSTSGETLVGANVILLGTALGSATDFEGEYRIVRIPEGNYTLKVSYVGYLPKEFKIVIAENKTVEFNVNLRPDIIEGQEIVVTGQAVGQAAAINQQLSANTIVNVVSEQKIQELPDVNAAEAIGRLPGVSILRSGGEANKVILRGLSDQYTTFTIDGIRIASTDASSRGLDLSTISQSSLAGIELFKAITADKDADAIAGSINLVTKKAPSVREISAIMKGNYNDIMSSVKQYDFSFKYGERFFDDVLGVQVNGNLENKIRSNESYNLTYDQTINNQTDYEISDFLLNFTDETRKRNGGSLLLDIATPDNGTIRINNVFNSTNRDYLIHNRDYPSGGGTGGTVTYTFNEIQQEIKTFNSSITGNNTLFGLELYWGLAFAQSSSETPYNYYIDFLEPSVAGSDPSGMSNAPRVKTNPERIVPYAYNNFRAATLYSGIFQTQKNFEKNQTAFLNITRNYTFGNSLSGELKIGGKYRTLNRSDVSSYVYAPYYLGFWQPYERLDDGSIAKKDLTGTYFDAFYKRFQANPINKALSFTEFLDGSPQSRDLYGIYKLNPLINLDKMKQWYELNKNGIDQSGKQIEYNNDITQQANFYNITETISSAYMMNTLNIGQDITFIAGLRIENENNEYHSKYSLDNIGGFPILLGRLRDTVATHKETIVLPNFHLNVKVTDYMNVRLAAYKTLARPDFNMRLNTYFAWRPTTTSSTKQLIIGNPLLKTAQSWNFQINTSFYGNEIGLISLSAFYNEIKNMHHILNGINATGDTLIQYLGLKWHSIHDGTYALTVPYNSPGVSKVWGFEFEHQINFTFLPGLLKNIVLSYNASIVRSQTNLISAKTDTIKYFVPPFTFPFYRYKDRPVVVRQQLENQPKFYGNISLGYDIGGFSGRVSLFYQSEYNISFSASQRGDRIRNPFTRLDLALKQQFTDYLSVMLNVSNLTNIKEENSIYNRINEYKILSFSQRYGLTADLGVKVTL